MATACFAVLDTTENYVGAFVSTLVPVGFREAFQAVAVTAVMPPVRGRSLRHTRPPFRVLRGLLLLIPPEA